VVYPLGKKDQAKPMQFPDASDKPVDMLFPRDGAFYDMLARMIEAEYADPSDAYMRGILQMIGIEKGKPFQPDPATRKVLDQAARTAFKMSRVVANVMIEQAPGGRYYNDRHWVNVFPGGDPFFMGASFQNFLERKTYFSVAYAMSPGMAASLVGRGAKYPGTFRDSTGEFLDGSHSYTLNVPGNIPAANFWSITVYDSLTAAGLDNGQPLPSINMMDKPEQNANGSIDFYFGPNPPANGSKNWMRTVPGKGFFVIIRLYSPTQEFFDAKWRPGDLVKIK
jgi:hypothetical protein